MIEVIQKENLPVVASHAMDFSRPKTARFWLRLQIKLIRWIGVAVRATLYRRPRHAQVLYSRTSPPFRCLVFRPSPENAKHADKVYVDFHGGAFIGGTPDEDAEFCTHIANKVGCVVVSGQYRFAPEHPYPTSLNDCHAVTEWAREEFRAKRLALGGFSAGGTLVLGVAQLLARSGRPAAALASFYPPVDFSPRSKSEFPEKNPWIRNMFHEVYLLNVPNDGLADPLLSPFYASPKELPASSMLFIPESDPNKPDMFELVDRINKEKPNTIRGVFMEKVFHGWNLLPEWIIGKQPTAKKWEVYDMVAEEVQRAFEK